MSQPMQSNPAVPAKAPPVKAKKHINPRLLGEDVVRHTVLALLAAIWLIPILWLVCTSFSAYQGRNILRFFPQEWSLANYARLFSDTDSVSNFPAWFTNTFIVACFTCVISSLFVLMIAYAMSCMRFRGRKALMNTGVLLGLFPGFLTMICIYYILKELKLTDTHAGILDRKRLFRHDIALHDRGGKARRRNGGGGVLEGDSAALAADHRVHGHQLVLNALDGLHLLQHHHQIAAVCRLDGGGWLIQHAP
jgi:hypothetical protein